MGALVDPLQEAGDKGLGLAEACDRHVVGDLVAEHLLDYVSVQQRGHAQHRAHHRPRALAHLVRVRVRARVRVRVRVRVRLRLRVRLRV